jgi:hypothetical protein
MKAKKLISGMRCYHRRHHLHAPGSALRRSTLGCLGATQRPGAVIPRETRPRMHIAWGLRKLLLTHYWLGGEQDLPMRVVWRHPWGTQCAWSKGSGMQTAWRGLQVPL